MQGSKEFFLRIKEEEYLELPPKFRQRAIVYYNDYEIYKDNEMFLRLNKNYAQAKKELEDWKFNQRHK